jgi:alkanesulfonate monooxygenase SsuD/methylene tetrahydromethanopterin reductase-like flavin-dependent oxidoreductase (luciferase family)
MRKLIDVYREAWRSAGHPGNGRVMIAFHMFCHENGEEAARIAREPLEWYLKGLCDAAGAWESASTKAYPGYDKMIAKLKRDTFASQIEQGSALIGDPETVAKQLQAFIDRTGEFEVASLQVNFSDLPFEPARRSMELFAREVMPRFAGARSALAR